MIDLQEMIYKTFYARWDENKKRRENWDESVDRFSDFFRQRCPEELQEEFNKAIELFRRKEIVPSMRAFWSAGKPLQKENAMAYNCAFTTIETIKDFPTILYLLMCGCGVGFSVEKKLVEKLPEIPVLFESDETIVVSDSREGWAEAYYIILKRLFSGEIPNYDLSKIRKKGERLKTSGGRASGGDVLGELIEETFKIFRAASEEKRKLSPIECHDLVCSIAKCVVAGGTRRSACISLSDLGDTEMRRAKEGQFWVNHPNRSNSNNSAIYEKKPSPVDFIYEMYSMIRSQSGERGIFNRGDLKTTLPERRDKNHVFGINPCVVGETNILTKKSGWVPIKNLVGKDVEIWNGFDWSVVKPFSTGENEIMQISFSDGKSIFCTPYHKFILRDNRRVEAKDLNNGDFLEKCSFPVQAKENKNDKITSNEIDSKYYSYGFYSGDGNKNSKSSWLYPKKYCCQERLNGDFSEESISQKRKTWKHGDMPDKDYVPVNESIEKCLSWLAGIIDSDGVSIREKNSSGIQISSVNKEFLLNISLMLNRLGCNPKVSKGRPEGEKLMPDHKGGEKAFFCKEIHRLLLNATDTSLLLSLGLKTNRVLFEKNNPQRDCRRFVYVTKIEKTDRKEETFCVSEPKNNSVVFDGILTGNCGEVVLRRAQFCNLSEVIIREKDSLEYLKEKIRAATLIGLLQSTLTNFKFISSEWKKNCEEERLIGVSLTGIKDHEILRTISDETAFYARELKNESLKSAEEFSKIMKVNMPAQVTVIKPSGTTSQLVNSSSGIHPRFSRYYIRRVTVSKMDPIYKFLKDSGCPFYEDDNSEMSANALVEFPVKSPDSAEIKNEKGAIEQLEHWKIFKTEYCEGNPSATIFVSDSEWIDVVQWVYKNWEHIIGLSFFPKDDNIYPNAPFKEISGEEYEERLKLFPKINWNELEKFENSDNTKGQREFACAGGKCEL